MPQDGGWVQLIEVPTRRLSARAHLMVDEITQRGWRGSLASIRTKPGVAALAPGEYVALFEPSREPHVVELDSTARGVHVRCEEPEEPSVLRERSDGN